MAANAPASGGKPQLLRSANELLALHDVAFVQAAYRQLLGREADDSGLASFVGQVRQGDEKPLVLLRLALSDEGRQHNPKLDGLEEVFQACTPRKRPWLARVLQRLGRALVRPANEPVERMLRVLDNRLYRIEHALDQQTNDLNRVLDSVAQLAITVDALTSQQQGAPFIGVPSSNGQETKWQRQIPPRLDQVMQGLRRAAHRHSRLP